MKVNRGVDSVKELIPFMNKVFRKRFPRLLPKLYTSDKYADNHYYVKENGKVVGALASIPNTLKIGEDYLDTRGIGMVSTHRKYRGKGIMSSMLKTAIADAKAENVDYMFLSGNRQRYEHYGFCPVGYKYTFTLIPANFKYMQEHHDYKFVRLDKDSPYLDDIIKIYQEKDVRYERYDFLKVVHSWNIKKVYAILGSDDKVIGHLATMWCKIVDFATTEPENTAYTVKAFAKSSTKFFSKIDLYPNMYKEIESMSKYAQTTHIECPAFFKVINYRNVIEKLLKMELVHHTLCDFDVNIVIDNVDSFNVKCKDNKISVSDYDDSVSSVTFSQDEATLRLFSPSLAPYNGLPFDLSLFVPVCDNV